MVPVLRFRDTNRLIAVCALVGASCVAAAETPFDPVMPLVERETFLIGRLDVEELPIQEIHARVVAIIDEIAPDVRASQVLAPMADQARQLRDAFLQAGGRELFLLVGTADVPAGPPFLLVSCSDPAKLDALQAFVRQLTSNTPEQLETRKHGERSLLVGTARTLDRLATLKAALRPEVTAAFNASEEVPVQLLIVPSANQLRVIRETMPAFPQPWDNVTGEVVADGVQWGIATVDAAPKLKVNLVIESKDAASAERLKNVVATSLDAIGRLPAVQQAIPEAGQLLRLLVPAVRDKHLTVSVTEDAQTLQAVSKPLYAAISTARQRARQAMSMNNLKQIALAMHMYHDKYKQFPPAASCDATGKPLLSWRVHLLPFLEQQALYEQFKLDEPWDSEHNKGLIDKVPPLYVDPTADLQPGLTTYLVPTGEGTVFGGKEGLRLQDIRDGSSNTLLVVSVASDRAVIWTKPEDLGVQEATPFVGLVTESRRQFPAALCDGSVHVISHATDPKILWLLFQANDGNPVDHAAVR